MNGFGECKKCGWYHDPAAECVKAKPEPPASAGSTFLTYLAGDAGDQEFVVDGESAPDEPSEYEAEIAAKDYHENHDGRESGWPLDITVVGKAGEQVVFSVECEFEPIFYAREKKNSFPHQDQPQRRAQDS